MAALVFYTVAAFGLSYIVGHSRISRGFRVWFANYISEWLVELVECPACFGFWLGLVLGSAMLGRGGLLPEVASSLPWLVVAIAIGCYTSGAGYLLGRLTGWLKEG